MSDRNSLNPPSDTPGSNSTDGALGLMAVPIKRAAFISGVSVPSLYREAGKGNIVLLKYGRSTLVDLASLRAFLARLPRASIRAPRSRA